MKTQQASFLGLALITLIFSACQKNGVVDMDLLNNKDTGIETQYPHLDPGFNATNPSSQHHAAFEILQSVELQKPDCATGSLLEKGVSDELDNSDGCYGKYSLTSNDGRGWVEEFGSITTVINLVYNPMTNEISGTIALRIEKEQATIVLEALGGITRSNMSSDGIIYAVSVREMKGTEHPGLTNFRGQVYIMHADKIFSNKEEYSTATVALKGAFGAGERVQG